MPAGASLNFALVRFVSFALVLLGSCAVPSPGQSQTNGVRRRFMNLYGEMGFNSTPGENLVSSAIGGLSFLVRSQQYLAGAQPDVTPTRNSRYDFVVVGAGTSGSTVAARLSEMKGVNVLLIEAGPEETLYMDVPVMANFLQLVDEIDWRYQTEPSNQYCTGMKEHRCNWPRGKVMGGSSVLNYMIATRGNPKDYDRWAELGNDGWSYKDVLKYFKKLESIQVPELQGDRKFRGTDGPVSIDYAPYKSALLNAFLEAGQELGYPLVDYNGEKQIGFSQIQSTMYKGYRMSSNRAYLNGKRMRNLYVTKMSMVHRILIDKKTKRAIGVEFAKGNRRISVFAKKEVILCAGAIGSPQLLMLSGIGPAEHLRELGIDVVKDARVGDNVMDHIVYGGLTFTVDEPVSLTVYNVLDPTKPYMKDFFLDQKGPLTISGGCEGIAFLDVDDPTNRDGLPNMELISLASSIYSVKSITDNFGLNQEIRDKFFRFESSYSWGVFPMILRPKSRGWIRLKSRDANVKPRIVANYLSHPDDVKVLVKGIRAALNVSRTRAMRKLGVKFYNKTVSHCERYPFDSDKYWECNLRTQTLTIYHYSGSCKMGPRSDSTAVVDPTLKVIGIEGLRVADASIIPEIPSGHTNIPAFMIAEKLADMVKKEWGYLTD